MPGHRPLAQSNAILTLIGRLHGLHPTDPFDAARHEAMMGYAEDLRAALGPTLRLTDEAEKKKAREGLVASFLPTWGQKADAQVGDGPFFGGAKINVVDVKLYMVVRWVTSGKIDHVPATIFTPYAKLMRLHDAVRDDARVKAWNAKWI
jgi:glutathione S-transferase